jgi:hypothetical protein
MLNKNIEYNINIYLVKSVYFLCNNLILYLCRNFDVIRMFFTTRNNYVSSDIFANQTMGTRLKTLILYRIGHFSRRIVLFVGKYLRLFATTYQLYKHQLFKWCRQGE